MNKKIICIGIIGMFLLVSVPALSAVETLNNIETKVKNNATDYPDLTVEINELNYELSHLGYCSVLTFRNEGDVGVEIEDIVYREIIKNRDGSEIWHKDSELDTVCVSCGVLEPDEERTLMPCYLGHRLKGVPIKEGYTLTVIVDPKKDIDEGDEGENNNIAGPMEFPEAKVKSKSKVIKNNLFFSLFNRLPVFKQLLQLINRNIDMSSVPIFNNFFEEKTGEGGD